MAKNVTGDTIYLSYYHYKFNVTLHLHLMEFQVLYIFKVQYIVLLENNLLKVL